MLSINDIPKFATTDLTSTILVEANLLTDDAQEVANAANHVGKVVIFDHTLLGIVEMQFAQE